MILDEVFGHREFGLRPLVSNAHTARRTVLGAHVVEAPNPSRWVPPQWVVLTTGIRLLGDEAAQRGLIAELAESGAVALGFGVRIVFEDVPPALLDEARRRDFPVFEVPEETPFREIVRAVDEAVLSQDLRAFRRSAVITDTLVRALGEPEPETALVGGLARLLHCGSSLHHTDGTAVFSSTSTVEATRRWRRLARVELTGPPVEVVDEDGLFATAVTVDGEVLFWVLLEVSRGSLAVPLILRALIMVGKLLEGVARVRAGEVTARRMAGQELLARLLGPASEDEPRDRARTLGIDLDEPARVLALSCAEPADALVTARQLLTVRRVPHLLTCVDDRLMVWSPSADLAEQLREATGAEAVGVGRESTGPDGVRTSGADAVLALARARLLPGEPIARYDELGLLEWLVLDSGVDRVAARAADVLAPLNGQEFLIETLRHYLGTSLSVPATARALHVHENSVRHRLERIRTLLGRDLRAAPVLAEIYLSLLLTS